MSTPAFSIRRTAESDWRQVRDLRLEMIRDTPIAYAESLEDALGRDEAEWRRRARRGTADHGIVVAAIADSGLWIGTMAAFVADAGTETFLVGVYVAPDHRGPRGITDALLTTIEEWARTRGSALTLHVHEDNLRARRAYARRGFAETGETVPYNLDPGRNEIVMAKRL